jgi:MoaA/NifB/PqqE/SkfB family radical SAM enzyme
MSSLEFPEHLEFDTFDYCNLNCVYCYLHNNEEECNRLPLHLIEKLMKQTVGPTLQSIRPWMNGDVLFETRLPEIIKIIRKYNQSPIHLFTNGTNYQNRHMLVNPEINEVHFTISAATSGTYALVHRRPLFKQALRTLQWFEQHKHPHQQIIMTFVITKQNIHELPDWRRMFIQHPQVLSALHKNVRDKHFTDETWVDAMHLDTHKHPKHIGNMPCVIWNNMAVSAKGDFIQCCEADVNYNYGNIADTPLLEAWRRSRRENQMRNKFCESCNVKRPDWHMILDYMYADKDQYEVIDVTK